MPFVRPFLSRLRSKKRDIGAAFSVGHIPPCVFLVRKFFWEATAATFF